jgi:hypothetical protein
MVKFNGFLFLLDFLFGAYFIVTGLNLVSLSFLDSIKNWIILVGGILLIISGMFAMRRTSSRYY